MNNKPLFDYWRIGVVLDTPTTRKWTKEEYDEAYELESKSVFSGFSEEDGGRSRRLICFCRSYTEAHRVVVDHNQKYELLESLQEMVDIVDLFDMLDKVWFNSEQRALLDKAKEVIAKAINQ
jgi:hypothetical protein